MLKTFETLNLGLVDYDEAFSIQEEKLKKRSQNEIEDQVILCSHPSLVTLGRGSEEEDLQDWTGKVKQINRGGRATYHGPGQIICYPIVKLKDNENLNLASQDVRAYLEALEGVLLKTLLKFGLNPSVESGKVLKPGQLNRGVWVEGKKIASIGIAIKKWVTMHGFALNFLEDEKAFTGIRACGFETQDYRSLQSLGLNLSREEVEKEILSSFKS